MLLEMKDITKTFSGLVANNKICVNVKEGDIHAIIGPNGAGKTTFFNCITGLNPSDRGDIIFNNENISGLQPHQVARKGIARTFQNIRLFTNMSVVENVKVGTHMQIKYFLPGAIMRSRKARQEEQEMHDLSSELLEKVGLADKKDEYARNLSYGEQRRLEIARALASRPKILLLDEPAAGMNHSETDELVTFIRKLRDEGITILLIEHDMKLVMSISDKISVIDHGVKIAEGTANDIQNDERVIEAYLGKRREG